MSLPNFLQSCLPSYDLNILDIRRDKYQIITGVLNKGGIEALRWLGKTYSQKDIKEVITSPVRGMWMRSILSYWLKIFNQSLDQKIFNQAVINFNPF